MRRLKPKFKTVFSESKSHTYFYRFVCDECGHETEWIPCEVTGEFQINKSGFGAKPGFDEEMLEQIAKHSLVMKVNEIKEKVSKGDYDAQEDRCPVCGKKQAWSAKGAGLNLSAWSLGVLIFWCWAVQFLMSFHFVIGGAFGSWLAISALAAFGIGLAIGFLSRLKRRKLCINMIEKHKLEFDWAENEEQRRCRQIFKTTAEMIKEA